MVSIMDTLTSMISGIVTFSILGAMAHDLDMPIQDVVKDGPGLAFVAYPEALLRLPFPQLWSVLFFLMLFILGLDSEVSFPPSKPRLSPKMGLDVFENVNLNETSYPKLTPYRMLIFIKNSQGVHFRCSLKNSSLHEIFIGQQRAAYSLCNSRFENF